VKKVIVTHHTPQIQFACAPLQENKAAYAKHNGYDFVCHNDVHPEWKQVPAQYSKLLYLRELLDKDYDVVVWADADIAFTNFTKDAVSLIDDESWLAGAREIDKPHPKYICTGLLAFRNCAESKAALDHCIALVRADHHTPVIGKQEQFDLNNYLQERDYKGVRACVEDEIGAPWEEIRPGSNARSWRYGDLHIHCSLLPWEMRGALFVSKYARKIVTEDGQLEKYFDSLTGKTTILESPNALAEADAAKIRLYLAIPCYDGKVSINFSVSLAKLAVALSENNILYCINLRNGETVHRARNKLAYEFLKTDCTHLLFIDSDIGFSPLDIIGMLTANMYVIGGVYPLKHYRWNRLGGKNPIETSVESIPNTAMDYCYNPLPTEHPNLPGKHTAKMFRRCIAVSEVGTGLMLIKREALEMWQTRYPYFSYRDDFPENRGARVNTFFEYTVFNDRYLSEDYHFCRYWREMGGQVWAWPWARLSHSGQHIFQGSFDSRVRPVEPPAETVASQAETVKKE